MTSQHHDPSLAAFGKFRRCGGFLTKSERQCRTPGRRMTTRATPGHRELPIWDGITLVENLGLIAL